MIEAIVAAALYAIVVSLPFAAVLFAIVAIIVRTIALDATVRHAFWTAALCTTALMPFGTLAVSAARSSHAPVTFASTQSPAWTAWHAAGNRRFSTANQSAGEPAPAPVRPWEALNVRQPHLSRTVAFAITGVWLAGVLTGLFGLVLSLRRVRGLKKRSSPLDTQLADELPWLTENAAHEREIYLRLSYEIETPVAIGFRRPVILIPAELATQAGLGAIEGLVLHEHAHLRRYDDWTNLLQRLIERLFWFNPLIWLFGRRIALEREIAADDAVVEATGRPREYAQALWQLAREMRMPEHAVVAPGALLTRKQISVRIEALLERRPVLAKWRPIAGFTVALTAIGCTIAAASTAPGMELPGSAVPPAAPAGHRSTIALPGEFGQQPRSSVIARKPQVDLNTLQRQIDASLAAGTHSAAAANATAAAVLTSARERIARAEQIGGSVSHSVSNPPTAPIPPAPRSVADCSGCDRIGRDGHRDASRPSEANGMDLSGADLSGRDLRGSDWRGRTLHGTNLTGADLRGSRLDSARFIGVNLSGAHLDDASLNDALMTGTNISGVSLHGAKTAGLRISGASLAGMDLRGLDVRSMLSQCSGCDLQGADLSNADLHGIRLSGANFAGANLRDVNLRGAVLMGSNFEAANLSGADLRDASLTGCSLGDANLHGADTRGTRFHGSEVMQSRN